MLSANLVEKECMHVPSEFPKEAIVGENFYQWLTNFEGITLKKEEFIESTILIPP